MRISENYKDKVVAATDITAVVGQRVELRKSGREMVGLCPFHTEKTPSFYVNPGKQVFKCHGCGASGSVIRFLMDFEGLGFHDAIELLAESAAMLPLEYEGNDGQVRATDYSPVYAALERAADFFEAQLASSKEAQAYCAARGIDETSIGRFRIGWAPSSWDGLIKALAGVPADVLQSAGLVIVEDGGRLHDRFRSRLMFPILDRRGRVIAFGGRVIGSMSGPKYLNSPETALFHKGSELFGLWQVRHPAANSPQAAMPAPTRMLVVEGYTDVVALHQHGLPIAVATLGTSMTAAHAEGLFPIAPDVCFCFDGDAAGRGAAWRALEAVLPLMREGRSASFLFLPEGEDPDSLVRAESGDAFLARVDSALPLSEYLFEHLGREVNLNVLEGRARLAERALPLIRKLPGGAFQSAMFNALEARTGVRTHSPVTPPSPTPGGGHRGGSLPAAPAAPPAMDGFRTLPRVVAAALLDHPSYADDVADPAVFSGLDQPGMSLLLSLLGFLKEHPGSTTAGALAHFRGSTHQSEAEQLEHILLPGDDEASIRKVFLDGIARLAEAAERADFAALDARVREPGGFGALLPAELARYRELMAARVARDRSRFARGAAGTGPAPLPDQDAAEGEDR